MIELIPFDEPHVVGFRMDGKIDDESYHAAVAAIEAALAANETINIYAEFVSLSGMALDVFFENFKVKFEMFRQIEKFKKEAIVTDKRWVEKVAGVADKLFPSMEIRHFSYAEKVPALDWVKE